MNNMPSDSQDLASCEPEKKVAQGPPRKKYECEICNKVYLNKKSLDRHNFFHSRNEFKCALCEKKLKDQRLLTNHYRRHTLEDLHTIGVTYFCANCGLGYQTEEEKSRHEKSHAYKVKKHICEICGKKFTEKFSLKLHCMIHTGEKPFTCEKCGMGFITKHLLEKHDVIHTGNIESILKKCDECGKIFQSSGGLSNHFAQKHSGRTFTCETCNKVFTSKQHLKQHNLIHTGEKNHACEICGKAFTHKSGLRTHCLTHTKKPTEKPFTCDICDKKFRTKGEIYRHYRFHAGEKPHKCEFCGKCFAHSNNLKIHTRRHTGERPFNCNFCDIKFTNKSSLQKHEAQHTDAKQLFYTFRCKLCGMAFKSKAGLSNHMYHHRTAGTMLIKTESCEEKKVTDDIIPDTLDSGIPNKAIVTDTLNSGTVTEVIVPDALNLGSKLQDEYADVQKITSIEIKPSIVSDNLLHLKPARAKLRPLRPKLPAEIGPATSKGMIVFQYKNNNVVRSSKYQPIAPAIPPIIAGKNMLTVLVPNTLVMNPVNK